MTDCLTPIKPPPPSSRVEVHGVPIKLPVIGGALCLACVVVFISYLMGSLCRIP
jgi:hypothetical protein